MADRVVTLRGERRLGLTTFGDPAAERVVVFCHPAPGAGGFDPDPVVTNHRGVHIVSVDRPGYGASTPLPDDVRPSVGERADDLAGYLMGAIQEARESGRAPRGHVDVIGWSAGGRIALALAARHPGLVDRVVVVATPAPDSAVRWVPREYAELLEELRALPLPEAKARLRGVLQAQAPSGTAGVEVLASGADDTAALQREGLRDRMERMMGEAYRQGMVGIADDLLSYATDDWGFDLAHVRARTLLVYGAHDPLARSAHGRWYRRHLPHAQLTVVPRSGHLVVATAWDRILDHVDPRREDAPPR